MKLAVVNTARNSEGNIDITIVGMRCGVLRTVENDGPFALEIFVSTSCNWYDLRDVQVTYILIRWVDDLIQLFLHDACFFRKEGHNNVWGFLCLVFGGRDAGAVPEPENAVVGLGVLEVM